MGKIVWQVMQSMIQNRLRLSNVFFVVVVFFFQQQVYTSKNIEHKTMDFSYPLPEVSWLARLVQWNIHILFGNKLRT